MQHRNEPQCCCSRTHDKLYHMVMIFMITMLFYAILCYFMLFYALLFMIFIGFYPTIHFTLHDSYLYAFRNFFVGSVKNDQSNFSMQIKDGFAPYFPPHIMHVHALFI